MKSLFSWLDWRYSVLHKVIDHTLRENIDSQISVKAQCLRLMPVVPWLLSTSRQQWRFRTSQTKELISEDNMEFGNKMTTGYIEIEPK